MRVLATTWGWRTHLYSMVPLVWALRAAGHEVVVASHADLLPAITGTGLPAVPVAPPLDFTEVFGGRVGRLDERATVTPDGGVVHYAHAMLDGLIGFGRHFRPDLVLFEPFNLAGAVASAALGVPGVRLLWGPDHASRVGMGGSTIVAPLADRAGVDAAAVPVLGTVTLDPCPPPMQVPVSAPCRPIRFVPYNGEAVLPSWLWAPPERPRVCLTLGYSMSAMGVPDPFDAGAVARAVAELDVELVLALDPARHRALGELPANVRLLTEPLALHLLLPSCRVAVHQGGAGSLMTALVAGVPQLVLPAVGDQHFNAERLAATGGGLALPAERADPASVRDRVAELLADERLATAAEVRDAATARPSPSDAVPKLAELAGGQP